MKFWFITIFVLLLFVGCKEYIKEGEVVNKQYEPANEYLALIPLTTLAGKGVIIIMVPMRVTDDEDYIITISDGNDSRQLWVSQQEYADANIGEWYKIRGTEKLNDTNIEKQVENK